MSMFGPEFEKIWPTPGTGIKLNDFCKNLLKKCEHIPKPDGSKIDLRDFTRKSSNFRLEFAIHTCRVISQPRERHPFIKQQIASAYPVIHERVLGLYLAFLEHKIKYGNDIENEIYKTLSLTEFIQRLLSKRCITFMDANDNYMLRSGEVGFGGFEQIGTALEKPPLILRNVLSYDEIKLSAFLSVSSHTEFINDGNRYNAGYIETDKTKIVPSGVVVGIIGGRFERENVMEWQDVMITPTQNTIINGYGLQMNELPTNRAQSYRRIWNQFYEENDYLHHTAKENLDMLRFYKSSNSDGIFDNLLLKKRYTLSFDTLLLESEARAAAACKQAYVHVVGIGLGVWKAVEHQNKIFLNTFMQRLQALLPRLLHIDVVHFSWFHLKQCGELKDGGMLYSAAHPNGGIRTFLSDRNPAQKLPLEFENSLLIVSYAWDGNAFPGNEFWMKMLTSTGDASTACSTLISELHNPVINTEMVCGNNLHIASEQFGILHIADYIKKAIK